jgi:hypothetical protein
MKGKHHILHKLQTHCTRKHTAHCAHPTNTHTHTHSHTVESRDKLDFAEKHSRVHTSGAVAGTASGSIQHEEDAAQHETGDHCEA